jgi:hypothetical protein
MKRNCEGEMIHLYERLREDTIRYLATRPQSPIVEVATRKREVEERGWEWMERKKKRRIKCE